MSDQLRKCGHPLGVTSWCPDCELAEARASGEFRKGYATTTHGRASAHPHEAADRSAEAKDAARWRRLVNASELPFPVATIADDPENDCNLIYGRTGLERLIDSYDEISDSYAAMGTPAAAEPGKGEGK